MLFLLFCPLNCSILIPLVKVLAGNGGVMVQWVESLYILKQKDCPQPPLELVTRLYFSHNWTCLGLETFSS